MRLWQKRYCGYMAIASDYSVGLLCGECGNGEGVSALLTNCITCSNTNIVLIPLLGKVLYILINITITSILHSNYRCTSDGSNNINGHSSTRMELLLFILHTGIYGPRLNHWTGYETVRSDCTLISTGCSISDWLLSRDIFSYWTICECRCY